jgi:hypothetical protein
MIVLAASRLPPSPMRVSTRRVGEGLANPAVADVHPARSTTISVWAEVKTHAAPSRTPTIARFGVERPGTKFRLDEGGTGESQGNTVKKPGALASVAVTFRAANVTPGAIF